MLASTPGARPYSRAGPPGRHQQLHRPLAPSVATAICHTHPFAAAHAAWGCPY